jgi:hypothetical protein
MDNKVKCCKPKCKPDLNKCNTVPFYQDPTFGAHLVFLNIIVIFARFKELNFNKHKGTSLFWFIFWLELQILFFYFGLKFFYWVLSSLTVLIVFIKYFGAIIIEPLSKKKGVVEDLKRFGQVLLKILLVFVIILLITLFFGLIILSIFYVVIFGPILLGYTTFN